ncbi:MAG: hypothetical protein FWG73_09825, partial [Planctomycetaceae bacterium]|nr:hypothetical protein [Planctomycetaceae bacterium]
MTEFRRFTAKSRKIRYHKSLLLHFLQIIRHIRYVGVQNWTLFTPNFDGIMKKSQSSPPKMGNNGGTAFVRINGKRIYLGKFGSPEAKQNYAQCVAEWAISNTCPGQPTPIIGRITIDSLAIDVGENGDRNKASVHRSQARGTRRLRLTVVCPVYQAKNHQSESFVAGRAADTALDAISTSAYGSHG